MVVLWPALAGALFLAAVLSESIGFLSFFVFVVLIWSIANRFGDAAGMTLTVADGSLVVTRGRSRSVLLRTPLSELHDARVDTVEKLGALINVRPVGNFGEPVASGPGFVDEARILLVLASGKTFPLTERDTSPSESADELAEIEVFLRKCGWRSATERGIVAEDEEEEEEDDDD